MKPNTVSCGDSVELLKTLPDDSIDLTITSPPYDNLRDYNGYAFAFESLAEQLYRVVKPGGVVVWIVGDATINGSETGSSFRQALHFKALGFRLHDTMIYEKPGVRYPDNTRYYSCFEYMFILSKGKPTFNPIKDVRNTYAGQRNTGNQRQIDGSLTPRIGSVKGRRCPETSCRRNIWQVHSGFNKTALDSLWISHPAVMPLQLAIDHVLSWSNAGDTVLDPMCGSGQTLIAAYQHGRQFIGIDCSAEYCDLSKRRLAHYGFST